VWGDKSAWTITDIANLVEVTPKVAGAETSLTLVFNDDPDGNRPVYTFLLKEGVKGEKPDLKLVAKADRKSGAPIRQFVPLAVHDAQLDALRAELAAAKTAAAQAQAHADERVATEVASFKQSYPPTIRLYHSQALNVAPFFVQKVWGDDTFTWVQLKTQELPTVYEVLDGKGSMLNTIALPGDGHVTTLKIPKVVSDAYLAAGKTKWRFAAATGTVN